MGAHTAKAVKTRLRRNARMRQTSIAPLLVAVLGVLVGLAILVYPVAATQWNNYRALQKAKAFVSVVESTTPEQRASALAAADNYNIVNQNGPTHDPWSEGLDEHTPEYAEYLSLLNLDGTMGRVVIPRINVDLPIYHGTGNSALDRGIGHLFGSSLPVGQTNTHSVLTAHTGFNNQTLFDNLKDVETNDVFFLHSVAGTLKYEIDDISVVLPTETDNLKIVPGEDLVTLITCTPYGVNSHRLLVRGHRVDYVPAVDDQVVEEAKGMTWQTWMTWVMVGAGFVLLILIFLISLIARQLIRNRRTSSAQEGPRYV